MQASAVAILAIALALLVAWPLPSATATVSERSPPSGTPAPSLLPTLEIRPHGDPPLAGGVREVNASNGSRGWILGALSGGPSTSGYGALADDPGVGGAVFFGGMDHAGAPFNDTWEYAQGAWTELCNMSATVATCPTAPSPRIGSQMAYDPSLHELVLFGGCGEPALGCDRLNDTWAFLGVTWANVTPARPNVSNNPPADAGASFVYDAADGYLLLFGTSGATWKYDANGWSNLSPVQSPSARAGAALFYDPASSSVILFGGATGVLENTPFSDTWSFHGGNWTLLGPTSSPPPGLPIGYAYDTVGRYGVVFGPVDHADYDDDQNYTWTWANGSWTNQTASFGPPPPASNSMVMTFDSTDGVTVLLSPLPPWDHSSATWLLRDPLDLAVNATASVVDVGESLSYSVTASGGVEPYRLALPSLPPGCGTRSRVPAVIPCTVTASGSYIVNVILSDRSGLASTVTLPLLVNADPLATITVTPNPTTVGRPVTFAASYVGGTGAISARWTFGDGAGFVGNDTLHTYAEPGSYVARLSSVDAAGFAFGANLTVAVDFGIHADAAVSRNVTDVGIPTTFRASGYGGTGGLSFAWSFGDGGTATLSECAYAYAAVGAYQPRVYVNDSVGAGATANVSLVVNPLPTAELIANASLVPAGWRVAFSAAVAGGTPPISYGWVFPDGTVSSSAGTTHPFPHVGTFTVRLYVHDAVGASVANSTTIRVTAAGPNGSTPSPSNGSSGPPVWGGVGAIVIGGAVAAALALFANSRRLKVRRLER